MEDWKFITDVIAENAFELPPHYEAKVIVYEKSNPLVKVDCNVTFDFREENSLDIIPNDKTFKYESYY